MTHYTFKQPDNEFRDEIVCPSGYHIQLRVRINQKYPQNCIQFLLVNSETKEEFSIIRFSDQASVEVFSPYIWEGCVFDTHPPREFRAKTFLEIAKKIIQYEKHRDPCKLQSQ